MAVKKVQVNKAVLVGIADDYIQGVTSISNYLEAKGIKTVWAYNGPDIVRICKEKKPDMVLLDVRFGGASGFDIARELEGTTKILFMTSHEGLGERAKGFKGSMGLIKKPVDHLALVKLIRKEFHLPSPEFE
jgi:DNA-binding response OmpR family regulator